MDKPACGDEGQGPVHSGARLVVFHEGGSRQGSKTDANSEVDLCRLAVLVLDDAVDVVGSVADEAGAQGAQSGLLHVHAVALPAMDGHGSQPSDATTDGPG
eukprot:CAMPEP_0117685678 /NCGR_PEP_ID=MMETSP0804-20121206/21914_1 /TAXON_ID=1074897 /ORGANISM="Tetraselmis astigmatica, Strain CCMP880" /LENGTH=100 /DNA_ID=CAMNT_0005497059 /DNA_START=108 /DNA_END=410 /DNA_ORIENTATION=+